MCTLTLIPKGTGYLLAMNRDEQRSRPIALTPTWHRLGDRSALFPSEPAGGTWIGINDAGASFALLNWYSVPKRPLPSAVSRGNVVLGLFAAVDPVQAAKAVLALPLDAMQPFRAVGVFPGPDQRTRPEDPATPHDGVRTVVEWRWDGQRLETIPWAVEVRHWISSAYDEPGARKARSDCFQLHAKEPDFGESAWLERMYRSHEPSAGPYSICMHREDAVTVSHTLIEWADGLGTIRYLEGPPCRSEA